MSLEEEQLKVAAKLRQATRGLTGEEAFEAGLRVALDHAFIDLKPEGNFDKLCDALDIELDAGGFLMGMMCAALAIERLSIFEVLRSPIALKVYREYIARAREETKRL